MACTDWGEKKWDFEIMETGAGRKLLMSAFVVLAVLCVLVLYARLGSPASAQTRTVAEYDVRVVPIQIGRDVYGLAMVDTVAQTLWLYEINSRGLTHDRLKLIAARSWRYDRMLQQYNTAEPKPEQVKTLLENFSQSQNESVIGQQDADINVLEMAEPNAQRIGR